LIHQSRPNVVAAKIAGRSFGIAPFSMWA